MKNLDSNSFEREIAEDPRPALVDFWSPTCQPCQQLMPELEQLEQHYGERVRFFKVNTAENRRLAAKQQVLGLPTVAIYAGGEKKVQLSGEVSRERLEAELVRHLEV